MRQSLTIGPPNSIFFLGDKKAAVFPEIDDRKSRIWSSSSGIIIGCLMSDDGETEFILSDSIEDVIDAPPVFDGSLLATSGVVEVSTSWREVLLQQSVQTPVVRTRIWTDHPSEPEHIVVVLG